MLLFIIPKRNETVQREKRQQHLQSKTLSEIWYSVRVHTPTPSTRTSQNSSGCSSGKRITKVQDTNLETELYSSAIQGKFPGPSATCHQAGDKSTENERNLKAWRQLNTAVWKKDKTKPRGSVIPVCDHFASNYLYCTVQKYQSARGPKVKSTEKRKGRQAAWLASWSTTFEKLCTETHSFSPTLNGSGQTIWEEEQQEHICPISFSLTQGAVSSLWDYTCKRPMAVCHVMFCWRKLKEMQNNLAFSTIQEVSCSFVWQVRKLRGVMGIAKPEAGLSQAQSPLSLSTNGSAPLIMRLQAGVGLRHVSSLHAFFVSKLYTLGPRVVLSDSALTCAEGLVNAWVLCKGLPE